MELDPSSVATLRPDQITGDTLRPPPTGGSRQSRASRGSAAQSRRSQQSAAAGSAVSSRDGLMIEPPRTRTPMNSSNLMMQAGRRAALPGYTGYIPGKWPENVLGKTFAVANEDASIKGQGRHLPPGQPAQARTPGGGLPPLPGRLAAGGHMLTGGRLCLAVERKRAGIATPQPPERFGLTAGHDVPGYMGFVPGRRADNVIGQTAAKGAETAWIIKARQKQERHEKVACYRHGEHPPLGEIDYSGYRSIASRMPGIDKGFSVPLADAD